MFYIYIIFRAPTGKKTLLFSPPKYFSIMGVILSGHLKTVMINTFLSRRSCHARIHQTHTITVAVNCVCSSSRQIQLFSDMGRKNNNTRQKAAECQTSLILTGWNCSAEAMRTSPRDKQTVVLLFLFSHGRNVKSVLKCSESDLQPVIQHFEEELLFWVGKCHSTYLFLFRKLQL